MTLLRTALFATFGLSLVVASGCGSVFESIFGGGDDNDGAGASSGGPGFLGGETEAGSAKPCTGLCLQQKKCANGGTTSLSGVVKDPAGKVPLYNVLVYVPNAPVAAITSGATCDRCGAVSGEPLVTALTGVDGRFKLDNVPVGAGIPLVIQIGKWRRQLVVPTVSECVDTALGAAEIRLPSKKSEGDIPQIALTTGGADVMECWLRKIGIDDSEFTTGTGDGRVHFYGGGTYKYKDDNDNLKTAAVTKAFDGSHGGKSFSGAPEFWSAQANLMKYDIVILSCEGTTNANTKPPGALEGLKGYANAGGRVFASHWHRYWFNSAAKYGSGGTLEEPAGPASPFEPFATWKDRDDPCNGDNCRKPPLLQGTISTTFPNGQPFPKGQAMHDWLAQPGVDALPNGTLPIEDPRHNADATDPDKATTWITMPNPRSTPPNITAVEYLSFNTPIPAPEDQKCGRVVYNDLHVTTQDSSGPAWPGGCNTKDLTPQEKALEFMLFDLSSCIQSDKEAPSPATGVH